MEASVSSFTLRYRNVPSEPFGYDARNLVPVWTQWRKGERIEAIRSFRILVTINKGKQSNK